jgi:hypothetical protein
VHEGAAVDMRFCRGQRSSSLKEVWLHHFP